MTRPVDRAVLAVDRYRPSYSRRMVVAHHLTPDAGPDRALALLLPGGGYTAQAPLLYWAGVVLAEAGWSVFAAEWGAEAREPSGSPRELVERSLDELEHSLPSPPGLIVGKSLGSFALPRAVAVGTAGVWLTPILTDPDVAAALTAASSDHLAIGGTADPTWRPDLVGDASAALVSVEHADHSLTIEDEWEASYAAQRDVFSRIAAHATAVRGGR